MPADSNTLPVPHVPDEPVKVSILGEVDGVPALPKGSPMTQETASEILRKLGDVAGAVDSLNTNFAIFKHDTEQKLRDMQKRVEGSLPPGAAANDDGAEAAKPIAVQLADIRTAQRDRWGLDLKGLDRLLSQDGRRKIIGVVTMVGAVYGALVAAGVITPRAQPAPSSSPPVVLMYAAPSASAPPGPLSVVK